MKKALFSLAIVLGLVTVANAQQGTTQLNAGIGIDSWKGIPVYVGLDYFVNPSISIGGEASFSSFKAGGENYSVFGVGANGNYHFDDVLNLPKEWNIYAGLNLVYYNYSNNNLNLGGQVGVRYFFSPNLGVNLQFGGGTNVSGGRLGITYKL